MFQTNPSESNPLSSVSVIDLFCRFVTMCVLQPDNLSSSRFSIASKRLMKYKINGSSPVLFLDESQLNQELQHRL